MSSNDKLVSIVETLEQSATGDTICVGDIVEALESRGFGALLLLPALLTFLPTGGIPGLPAVTATVIILAAAQLLFGRKHIMLPKKLKAMTIRSKKVQALLDKTKPALKFIDYLVHARFDFMFNGLTEKFVALASILLAASFFVLALIPFTVMLPSGAIILMALGLTARDGLLVLVGMILSFVTLYALQSAIF